MGQGNILRGEKWSKVKAKAIFEERTKDVEWLDSQEAIVKDIKAYEDTLKPVEVETKSKGKK